MERSETIATESSKPKRRTLNVVLWVVQGLLALAYLAAGIQKTFFSFDTLATTIFWTVYVPHALTRFIGVSELLGAAGLIVPVATNIQPRLTTLAAAGLTFIMASASILHAVRGETIALPTTITLFLLDAFVAYGRWKLVPLTGKN
jgi:putative oxidoreductase